jgi:hypothetical protein
MLIRLNWAMSPVSVDTSFMSRWFSRRTAVAERT